MQFKII